MEKIIYVMRPDLKFSVLSLWLVFQTESQCTWLCVREVPQRNNDITLKRGKTTLKNTWYNFEDTVITYLSWYEWHPLESTLYHRMAEKKQGDFIENRNDMTSFAGWYYFFFNVIKLHFKWNHLILKSSFTLKLSDITFTMLKSMTVVYSRSS